MFDLHGCFSDEGRLEIKHMITFKSYYYVTVDCHRGAINLGVSGVSLMLLQDVIFARQQLQGSHKQPLSGVFC